MFFDLLDGSGHCCAHRGARSLAPENTLLAVRRALDAGAQAWETDVHMTRDGQLVIFHDETLERTTDIAAHPKFADRKPWNVHDFTLDELLGLDAGSHFAINDPFGTIAAGELSQQEVENCRNQPMLTLRQALEFTREHTLPMNLEIKDQGEHHPCEAIVDAVLDMIRQTETRELMLLSSFRHEYMARVRQLDATLPTAALAEEHPADIPALLRELGAQAYHPNQKKTTPELVRELVRQGFRVNPWTVNDMDKARALGQAGATAIITDFPQRMK
ncbi:glycerophosphodiester phosphodiesterase [Pseudodesulfovibrio senegalensis]|uniref:Glycerophosphodiester phosphodiesterase n=1 Tax=Pseudodesulfovibrio senegalensis TaxID=1721087 RepID=A0A6N6MY84_9BACT|nr:glycerophosphodiester phosphodiesterase family protein [Pseudodesulfovibrio senegalensis]KAB1439027.1 glycerophosphodiester phosphodiesterase [Pseudodesulfovibrio senegalensis]